MKELLDDNKPLYTCDEVTCKNCNVKSKVTCHFNMKSIMRFFIMAAPSFIIAGIGIYLFNYILMIPWIAFILLYFGLIEIRVMCSHCPHYAEPEIKTLKCWANYGCLKIWRYRPGPMSLPEKILFFSGIVVMFLYPIVIMAISKQFILLSILVLYIIIGGYLMHNYMCKKCMNFACPLNSVTRETRDKFLKHNSIICKAWNKTIH
jgi:hypothetical protein